jgi:hypothetical protein
VAKAGCWSCVLADDKTKTDAALKRIGYDILLCSDGNAVVWRSDVVRAEAQLQPWSALKSGQGRIVAVNWSVTLPIDRLDQVNKVLKGTVE